MDKKPKMKRKCTISDEVIATIAGAAACEVPGVVGTANRPVTIKGLVASSAQRAVIVNSRENTISLDVYVNIRSDAKIQQVSTAIQQNVKAAVQAMTGKPVTRVNVNISGVVLEEAAAQ